MQPQHFNNYFHGPLRVSAVNPRYLCDDRNQAIYLTGSHTWANLLDVRHEGEPVFDNDEYLAMMEANSHNFIRLWAWHHGPIGGNWSTKRIIIEPIPYLRTGPDLAEDGLPRFDLTRFNPAYFKRLRERVLAACERGIYVSVMLFEGNIITHHDPTPTVDNFWHYHPFNERNNVNGVNGDPNGDGWAELYNLAYPELFELEVAYVRQVVDTVNDLDNVLYEVANELDFAGGGLAWQSAMADYVHTYERGKPNQHVVGICADGMGKDVNADLFASPADWIAPYYGPDNEYMYNPPSADGRKVIFNDTDHLWGIGRDYRWVWRSFLRGLNPLFMDPWLPSVGDPAAWREFNSRNYADWGLVRANMGHTRRFAERLDLNVTLPHGELSSSGYCLANPGSAYLVYVPEDAVVYVNLSAAQGMLGVEWFYPRTGETTTVVARQGGKWTRFASPLGIDAVLFLQVKS